MLDIKSPIALIDNLSERTINSLNNNKIYFVSDLFPYKNNISELLNLPGVGKSAIKELDIAFKDVYGYKDKSLNSFFNKYDDFNNDITELDPFFKYNEGTYYLGSLCYTIFKDHRLKNTLREKNFTFYDLIGKENFDGIKNIGKNGLNDILHAKYKILEYYGINNYKKLIYIYNNYSNGAFIFKQVDSFDLGMFIMNFYNSLPEIEKYIILNRENRFIDSTHNRLHELGKEYNITRERIRQIEGLIISDFDYYLEFHSNYFEKYINNLFKLSNDFEIIKFGDIKEFQQFSYLFISNILSKIISTTYLFHGNEFSKTFSFIKKSKIREINNINIFDKIDSIFYKERKINKSITLDEITEISIGLKKKIEDYKYKTDSYLLLKDRIEEFKPIVKEYLECCFELKADDNNNKITFPLNKRDYPTIIIHELILYGKPIHYSKLLLILKKKYPQFSWKEGTVHGVLVSETNAINAGPGIYIYKSKKTKLEGFKKIVDIIELFLLSSKTKCATINDIIKHVKKHKKVSEKSIRFYLNNSKKFINIGTGLFGLTEFREGKVSVEKPESISNLAEKYLEGQKNKYATVNDIIKYIKGIRTVSEESILRLTWNKKGNKYKFVRIGPRIIGLTKYRDNKVLIQEPESISSLVEKYLELQENKYASVDDIVDYVKTQRNSSKTSVIRLFQDKRRNRNRFIRIGVGLYGLTKYRDGKLGKPGLRIDEIENNKGDGENIKGDGENINKKTTMISIIEDYLGGQENKCASTDDIINYVQKFRNVSGKSIKHYISSKTKNKNKFINVGKGYYGLREYREGKNKLDKSQTKARSGTILNLIETYLEQQKDKYASTTNIVKYVKQYMPVTDDSIKANLRNKNINHNKIICIGSGKYGLYKYWGEKPKPLKFCTIIEIIEKYLEERNDKCATLSDIIDYVKNQKGATEKSIISYLLEKKRNKNKITNIGNRMYGLTKYWGGKTTILDKKESINDLIERYLSNKTNKCATTSEIIDFVKNNCNASEITIIRHITNKKINKNKFIRIGTGIYGLTEYRNLNK